VRGWSVRGLGPGKFSGSDGRVDFIRQTGDLKLDLSMEYRTHLFWKVDGAAFLDGGNIWTFLFGVIDVCICAFANFDSGNMGQFLQHTLYFLPMQFVGFWQWRKRGADTKEKVRARRLSKRQWWYVIAAFIGGTALAFGILYWIDAAQLKAGYITEIETDKILLDAAVVVLNILGQVLLSFAYADQWYIWNLVNVFSIMLWTNRLLSEQASSYTVVMVIKYSFYLLNSINGLRIWLKLAKEGDDEIATEKAGCC